MESSQVQTIVRDGDLRRSRLTVFFRLLLALPHLVWLALWSIAAVLVSPAMWIATLVTRKAPDGLHELYARLVRYSVHVYAYATLAADPFPGFLGARGSYPVDVEVPAPEQQGRWSVGLRIFLVLPAVLLATALLTAFGGGMVAAWSFNLGVVSILAWFACLARGRMPRGFRDGIVYTLGYAAQASAYLLLLTPRYADSDPTRAPGAIPREHPVRLRLRVDDLARDRLTVFFRALLALPHLVWLELWGLVVVFAAIGAWFAGLFTGRVPDGLHGFMAAYVRYQAHVGSYLYLAADPFPGFTGAPGRYPVDVGVDGSVEQPRWTVGVRIFLAFPALLVAAGLGYALLAASILGWFAALFTARMPRGLRNLMLYVLRYNAELQGYALLLTPRYPYSGPEPV